MFKWLDKLEEAIPGKAASENVQDVVIKTTEALLAERGEVEEGEEEARQEIDGQEDINRNLMYPPWYEFLLTTHHECEEPFRRALISDERNTAIAAFTDIHTLSLEYHTARDTAVLEEDDERRAVQNDETTSEAHQVYAMYVMEAEEGAQRGLIEDEEDARWVSLCEWLVSILRYEEEQKENERKAREGLETSETEDREAMLSSENSNWEALLFQEHAQRDDTEWGTIAEEYLSTVLAELDTMQEACLGQLLTLHNEQQVEYTLVSETDSRRMFVNLEEETWRALLVDELNSRKAKLREGAEKEELQKEALRNTIIDEERERKMLYNEEDLEVQEIISLQQILLSAFKSEIEAKRTQMGKAHARARRDLEGAEHTARELALIEEANGRCELEDDEYVARSESMIEERRRVAEEMRITKILIDTEHRERHALREEAEMGLADMLRQLASIYSAYQSWLHSLSKQKNDFFIAESQSRSIVSSTSYYTYNLIYCELTECTLRDSIEATYDYDPLYVRCCMKLEQEDRKSIAAEQAVAAKKLEGSGFQVHYLLVTESLKKLVDDEETQRIRVQEEEEIFRGSLVYRVKHEAMELVSKPVLPRPASPSVVVHVAPSRPVERVENAFEEEEFALENLMRKMEASGSVEIRFYEGEHAQINTDCEMVCTKCKYATCGWNDDKLNYLGKAGLICQTNLDSALIYFADGRKHWFSQAVLSKPSEEALKAAPTALPENPAVKISRSICRTYLNTVLPGGDEADALTIGIYVGIPILLFMSIVFMMYYRTRSGV